MSASGLLRTKLRCYALVAGLGLALLQVLALSAGTQDSGPTRAQMPLPPRPAMVDPRKLPAVFSQAVPASIGDLKTMEVHVKALVARVSPTIVEVEVGNGRGSGVVISADGLVLTAGHVCRAPNREVGFRFPDGRATRGKTLGMDRKSDIGLMRITEEGSWPQAAMGDLSDTRIGDWVLALGHPGGLTRSGRWW